MPRKVKFESFKYRFLAVAQRHSWEQAGGATRQWPDFVGALEFEYEDGAVGIAWHGDPPGRLVVPLAEPRFYVRGDDDARVAQQRREGLLGAEDPVRLANEAFFRGLVARVADLAGYVDSADPVVATGADGRLVAERAFHDEWAGAVDVARIDVRAMNEACTAPEMRYITARLGDVHGKRVLDLGCGLGEASVYFAVHGARVTALDLSQGMLDATCRLARAHGVDVAPHLGAAEDLALPADARFDVIYAGNLLHHVDIARTLSRLACHLAPGGLLVTWDPVAYNPAINVYRALATHVRTPDEHPLTWQDIRGFQRYFDVVETRYFWLTTLVVFMLMAVVQRRSPNKERYWKVVVQEADWWRPLYAPLEAFDRAILRLIPPLRLLCWNVVVVCARPRETARQ